MKEIIPFAKTNFRNKEHVFGIKKDDRRRHMYVIGKTGAGKSVLLRNMMISDIKAGNGAAVIDPHGEFAESILDYIPEERIKDVVYFNPADLDNPIAFNIAESVKANERHLVASGLIGIFKKLWADSWGPRLEYVLRNTLLALLEDPDSTLLGVMRMFSDKEYRKDVLEKVTDPVIKSFWENEYAKYSQKFEVEAVAPIQNKIGQFLTNPLIRNIVGQKKSSINMRDIMDHRKILIVNLSKGRIGEDTAKLLGAMIITKISLAAMSRVDILNEEDREDFFVYIDEFQNFATESFSDILSEARKYRLSLILTHQYVGQLEDTGVKEAIMGNVGTLVVFRVGAEDAEFFQKEFAPQVDVQNLVSLPNYKIYLKLMINGVASSAFSANTLPPIEKEEISYAREIIKYSREHYSTRKEYVESEIAEWSRPIQAPEDPNKPKVKMYDTQCSRCKRVTQVPFEPSPGRDVFCKDCYAEVQRENAKNPPKKQTATTAVNKTDSEKGINAEKLEKREIPTPPISPASRIKEGSLKTINEEQKEEAMSLSDALSKGAVSFSGKKIKKEKSVSPEIKDSKKSGIIRPGESVKL